MKELQLQHAGSAAVSSLPQFAQSDAAVCKGAASQEPVRVQQTTHNCSRDLCASFERDQNEVQTRCQTRSKIPCVRPWPTSWRKCCTIRSFQKLRCSQSLQIRLCIWMKISRITHHKRMRRNLEIGTNNGTAQSSSSFLTWMREHQKKQTLPSLLKFGHQSSTYPEQHHSCLIQDSRSSMWLPTGTFQAESCCCSSACESLATFDSLYLHFVTFFSGSKICSSPTWSPAGSPCMSLAKMALASISRLPSGTWSFRAWMAAHNSMTESRTTFDCVSASAMSGQQRRKYKECLMEPLLCVFACVLDWKRPSPFQTIVVTCCDLYIGPFTWRKVIGQKRSLVLPWPSKLNKQRWHLVKTSRKNWQGRILMSYCKLESLPWLCTCCFPNHGFPAGCYTKYISDSTCPRALCLAQCRGAIHILSFLSRKEKHPNANLAQIFSIIITRGISRYSE